MKNLLVTMGLGAGLMYFFDPVSGRRRRAIAGDKLFRFRNDLSNAMNVAVCDLRNRTRGFLAEVEAMLTWEEVSDERLVARVRAKLGRFVSHSHAIEVEAHDSRVVLRGPIQAREVPQLLTAVATVRGVKDVVNELDVHEIPASEPGLQGGRQAVGERSELIQENWSPAARLLAGATGTLLMARCAENAKPWNMLLGTVGFWLFVRGTTNLPVARLLGSNERRRAGFQTPRAQDVPVEKDRVSEEVSSCYGAAPARM